MEAVPPLALFIYGTLMRGQPNHEPFCRGYARALRAAVRGRLYESPSGLPALVVHPEDVRATGTEDPREDSFTQRRLSRAEDPTAGPVGTGPRVFGELLLFEDFEERLPALDRFEGFDPESGTGLYRRVLVPVETRGAASLAWTYVAERSPGVHLPGGRWCAPRGP